MCNIRIEQLYYLIEVAKTRSIRLAAERSYISPQSLSEAIRKLEQYFGVDLLERSYQGVLLTEEGKMVVDKATLIIKNVEDLKKKFESGSSRRQTSLLTGDLSIIIASYAINNIFYETLETFSNKHSNVNILIKEDDIQKILLDISTGKAELGIVAVLEEFYKEDESSIGSKDICIKPLFDDKMVACVGNKSPLANRKSISMKELLKYPVVIYQAGPWGELRLVNFLKEFGKPKKIITSSNANIFIESIVKGLAVGLSSYLFLKANPSFKNNVTALTLNYNLKLNYGLVYLKNRNLSEAAKEFIALFSAASPLK